MLTWVQTRVEHAVTLCGHLALSKEIGDHLGNIFAHLDNIFAHFSLYSRTSGETTGHSSAKKKSFLVRHSPEKKKKLEIGDYVLICVKIRGCVQALDPH